MTSDTTRSPAETSSASSRSVSSKRPHREQLHDPRVAAYFHGLITNGDAEELAPSEGEYLLRASAVSDKTTDLVLTLSVRCNGHLKHFLVNRDEQNQYYFDEHEVRALLGKLEPLAPF